MPLIKSKSKKAMSKNIEAEMEAGKPQKQSVAIAYDIMRRAKKKKMAFGGAVEDPSQESLQQHISEKPSDKEDRSNVLFDGKAERIDPMAAEMKEDAESEALAYGEDDESADDIVSRIMRKMRRKA